MRFKVQAVDREGFKFYMRAGHAWPRMSEGYREIEVVEGDGDAPGTVGNLLKVSQASFEILSKDSQLRLYPSDSAVTRADASVELAAARARIAELEAELSSAKGAHKEKHSKKTE
jgi:hypothetical protein